jgi:tetratricopeptide (TPR) repeat protein
MRVRTAVPAITLAIVLSITTLGTTQAAGTNDARLAGIELFKSARYAEAIPYFDQVLAKHDRDVEILNKRGICYIRTEQAEKALADFDRIIQHSARFAQSFGFGPIYNPNQTWLPQPTGTPVFAEAHGNRGVAMLMLGRDEEALRSFLVATHLWKNWFYRTDLGAFGGKAQIAQGHAAAYQGLGQAYHRLGQNDLSVQAYGEAIAIYPLDPNGFAGRGDTLAALRIFDQAVADYSEAIRLDSSHSRAFAGRGIALSEQGRFEPALTDLNQAIKLDPKFAKAFSYRGAILAQRGQNEQALADYNTLIGLYPGYSGAYKDRGGVLVRLGRFDRAIDDLNEAIRLDPKRATAYLNRGAAYNGLGQYERAIDDLSEAIRLNPENAGAYTNRGLAHFATGRYDKAIVDLSEAIQLAPRNAIPFFNRAEVFDRLGMRDRALLDYSEAIRLEPRMTPAYVASARIRKEQGQSAQAIHDFDMALGLDPKEIGLLEDRGNARREQGDWLGALADYDRAVILNPKRAETYVIRGWSRLSAGVDGADLDARAYLAIKGWRDGLAPHMAVLAVVGARAAARPQQGQLILEEALANLPPRTWPVPILRYLKGDLTAPGLLQAAVSDQQLAEAHLFIGLDKMQAADRSEALSHLRWVEEHGAPGSIATDVAKAILTRVAPNHP